MGSAVDDKGICQDQDLGAAHWVGGGDLPA